MKTLCTFAFLLFASLLSFSQDVNLAQIDIVGGDTIPLVTLDEVSVFSKSFKTAEERSAFDKLKKNTYKVYPYVETAVQIYNEMQSDLSQIDKRRQQKRYINEREAELREKFEKEIRDLNHSQGQVLIKLINRETGNNCYEIIKDMKGSVVAFFWNLAGKRYDYNFKEAYKPEENKDLEFIVEMMKSEALSGK